MTRRYRRAGRLYDLLSLEALLYRRPRARLMELLGPLPNATVVDLGCGTGLDFEALRNAVGPGGFVVGIDDSSSMLDAARRRIHRARWSNVVVVEGDAADFVEVLASAGVAADAIDALVATFVLSLLDDDGPVWLALDELAERRPRRIALADLGPPAAAPRLVRPVLGALTNFGGADPRRRPWERLLDRAPDSRSDVWYGGHVHLAAGTWEP